MDTTDLAYAAGIIDGEGCISLGRHAGYYQAHVTVEMSDRPVIEWLHATFPSTHIYASLRAMKRAA